MRRTEKTAAEAPESGPAAGFVYQLPKELIAQRPAAERAQARLLAVARGRPGALEHGGVHELPERLAAGDLLVRNRSRVFPARLRGVREPGGGAVEVLLLHATSASREPSGGVEWRAMARPAKRLHTGQSLLFTGPGGAELPCVVAAKEEGSVRLRFPAGTDVLGAARLVGEVPLPPYIERPEGPTEEDLERYQTIFAREEGSVAAPTAGLHLTEALFARLAARGVGVADIVLHVGPATFLAGQPGRSGLAVEPEFYFVPPETVEAIRACTGRVIAVGTTTTRALESAARSDWPQAPQATNLILHPGERFDVVQGLLTNFHLPGSSLLALVAGFAGSEVARQAYECAVAERYRFYSYGDAMLIL
ncbi:MAG: tRNA preQ1(34) S-adenosylmethionine ribosyltransferase-isomerase QueA [Deltaproteobacteria bacterium]